MIDAIPRLTCRGQHVIMHKNVNPIFYSCLCALSSGACVSVRARVPPQGTKRVSRARGVHRAPRVVKSKTLKVMGNGGRKIFCESQEDFFFFFLENVVKVIVLAVMVSNLGLLLRSRDACWAGKDVCCLEVLGGSRECLKWAENVFLLQS